MTCDYPSFKRLAEGNFALFIRQPEPHLLRKTIHSESQILGTMAVNALNFFGFPPTSIHGQRERGWNMRGVFSIAVMLILATIGSTACRTAKQNSESRAELLPDPPLLMGVKDVSLYLTPWQNLRLSAPTGDSVIFPQNLFLETLKLADDGRADESERKEFEPYDDWLIAAVRIDSCAKILPEDSCATQLRLVAQPANRTGIFRDHAIHLAFQVDEARRIEMFQDFFDYKKATLRAADREALPKIIQKYALASHLERVAIMLTAGRVWTFAASLPIKDGKILPTAIPCVGSERIDFVASEVAIARREEDKIKPAPRCQDLNAHLLLTEDMVHGHWQRLSAQEKEKEVQTALRINDPTKVFFGSTDCVSCHVAGRALLRAKGQRYLEDDPNDPNRYQRPADMKGEGNVGTADHFNAWGTRAFGYGQDGQSKAMSLYTFNDSLRVAHEINELIRAGILR